MLLFTLKSVQLIFLNDFVFVLFCFFGQSNYGFCTKVIPQRVNWSVDTETFQSTNKSILPMVKALNSVCFVLLPSCGDLCNLVNSFWVFIEWCEVRHASISLWTKFLAFRRLWAQLCQFFSQVHVHWMNSMYSLVVWVLHKSRKNKSVFEGRKILTKKLLVVHVWCLYSFNWCVRMHARPLDQRIGF